MDAKEMFSLRLLRRERPVLERLAEILELKAPNTARTYRSALTSFLRYAKIPEEGALAGVAAIGQRECISYLAYLKKKRVAGRVGVAPSTLRLKVDALRSVWGLLIEMKACSENPWGRVGDYVSRSHAQRRPTQLISPEKVSEMLTSYADPRNRALLCVLFGGALRRSEARALTCGDVTVQADGTVCLRLQETKAGESATVALPDWAGSAVLQLLAERRSKGTDWLFVETFKHRPERQMSEASFYRVFKRAASAIGMPGAAPHAARASAITKLLQDGFAPYDVAEFSRHASLDMLKVYDKRRREITEGLGKKLRF